MVTRVRQRLVREREQRRGRLIDPAWAHRMVLLRGSNNLKLAGRGVRRRRPTDELSAVWGQRATPPPLASAAVETAPA
jgi:hypothetical protein